MARMNLGAHHPIAFIPTREPAAARVFYEEALGLTLESEDPFALVFRLGPAPGIMLRVVHVGSFTPAPFTILGWETSTLEADVDNLIARNVQFLRYGNLDQDDRGIWTAPGATRIAWFKDPDGNTLSLSQP